MSPPRVVIQAVDHGTVFLEHGAAVPVLLVCLHEDAEKEHHTPVPTAVQACFEVGTGPLVERRRRDEENKVHPHNVMTWKGPAVDKLVAQKVLVTYVKAAEDLDLSPVFTAASALVTSASSAVEYHFHKAVCGFRSMERAQSWQTNGYESRANNGLSFC